MTAETFLGISKDMMFPVAALWFACFTTLPLLFLELRYRKIHPRQPEIGEASFRYAMTLLGSIWLFTAAITLFAIWYS